NTVAVVQALEAILQRHARGQPGSVVEVNTPQGGLVLRAPGQVEPDILYPGRVWTAAKREVRKAMGQQRLAKNSKYLSKHLQHEPERLGLELAPGGWVEVEELLAACARNAFPITRAQLEEVVAKNDKQRFSFDDTGTRIRANQGHTTDVDLQLEPAEPPAV